MRHYKKNNIKPTTYGSNDNFLDTLIFYIFNFILFQYFNRNKTYI